MVLPKKHLSPPLQRKLGRKQLKLVKIKNYEDYLKVTPGEKTNSHLEKTPGFGHFGGHDGTSKETLLSASPKKVRQEAIEIGQDQQL